MIPLHLSQTKNFPISSAWSPGFSPPLPDGLKRWAHLIVASIKLLLSDRHGHQTILIPFSRTVTSVSKRLSFPSFSPLPLRDDPRVHTPAVQNDLPRGQVLLLPGGAPDADAADAGAAADHLQPRHRYGGGVRWGPAVA